MPACCGCCTTRASATTRRACGESRATWRGLAWRSSSTQRAWRATPDAPAIAAAARATPRPSELAALLRPLPVEAVALAGADGAQRQALRWLDRWRHLTLEIDGRDLIAAGVPAGPEIGRRLAAVM